MTVSVQIQYFTVGLHMLESGCDIKHFYSEVRGLKFMDVVVSLFLFSPPLQSLVSPNVFNHFVAEWQRIYAPKNIYITYCGPPTLRC